MGVRFSLGVLIKFSNIENIKVKDEKIIVPCNDSVNELFICQCNNVEHQLIFSYFSDDEDRDVGDDCITITLDRPDDYIKSEVQCVNEELRDELIGVINRRI